MTTLMIPVLWCVLQVTLVGLLTAGLYLVVRRFSPASSAGVLLSGMVVAALLAVTAASPWPSWARGPSTRQPTSQTNALVAADEVAMPRAADVESFAVEPSTTLEEKPDREKHATAVTDPPTAVTPGTAFFDRLLSGFDALLLEAGRDAPSRTVLDEPIASTRILWPMFAGAVFGLAAIIGVLRFAIGWLAVRRQVARSRVLNVAALDELSQTLCRELGCRRPVALRESAELATAATVGWRRPVILLPSAWNSWTDDECRAVLAHELAHVARGHFACWLVAQTGLVLHFYHPLIHWLASRLRLEQEYEADALAARVTGGPQPYLQTLARLALHQSDTLVGWPARAFLPTRRTFLRRIEMLRQTKHPWQPSRLPRSFAVIAIASGGVLAAGLRGAQTETPEGDATVLEPADEDAPSRTRRHWQQVAAEKQAAIALDGTWSVQHISSNGDVRPIAPDDYYYWTFDAATKSTSTNYKLDGNEHPRTADGELQRKNRFSINPTTQPKELTIYGERMLFQAIYDLDGDNLKVAIYGRSELDRPDSFDIEKARNIAGSLVVFSLRKVQPSDTQASPSPQGEETAQADGPIELSYIPGDAVFVMAYRPLKLRHAIQESERLAPLSKGLSLLPVHWLSELVEKSVVQLSLVGTPDDLSSIAMSGGQAQMPTTIYRTLPSAPLELSKLKEGAKEFLFGRTLFYRKPGGEGSWFAPDEDTLVWNSSEDQIRRLIANGPQVRSGIVKTSDWQAAAEEAHVAVAINLEMLGRLLPVDLSPYLALLTPLWESGDNAVVSARIENERIYVRLVVNCRDEEGTQAVRETLVALKTLYGNILSGLAKQADRVRTDPTEAAMIAAIINAPRELITAAEIESTGKQVVLTASHEIDAELVELLVKVIENAQQVAQRQNDRNDLKQLGLALHNHHDVFLHFPSAVVVDKDSGVPRSWRVEVLPYLGETDLYTQYLKDEPWDSEHNKQILAQMPDVFRSTGMASDSTETRYLAPVGQGTAFDPAKPVRIRDISDGTSNTLMIVQSPTETVPWTKPDDLPVDLDVKVIGGNAGRGEVVEGFGAFGALERGAVSHQFPLNDAPKQLDLGGLERSGFLAVFCDGAVGALKKGIAPTLLRQLLCRADGRVLNPGADYLDKSETDRISRLRSGSANIERLAAPEVPGER